MEDATGEKFLNSWTDPDDHDWTLRDIVTHEVWSTNEQRPPDFRDLKHRCPTPALNLYNLL